MAKQLYFECSSGISGDMAVGAMLDLGADREILQQVLDSLPLDGYAVTVGRRAIAGIDACDFDVKLDTPYENHDHDMAYLYGDGSEHAHHHGHHHHNLLAVDGQRGFVHLYSLFPVDPGDRQTCPPVLQCLWQLPPIGQLPQEPPQEDPPCFFVFAIPRMIHPTSNSSRTEITMVDRFCVSHTAIKSAP